MGLDMYLTAERYVSGYDFAKAKEQAIYRKAVALAEAEEIADPETPSATIQVTAAYWRKANHIHRWFVEHVQGGEDECRPFYVGREQLEQLRETCRKVLADPSLAADILPTQEGFFFGGTEYDKWYRQDCENTIAQLNRVLGATEGDYSWEFEYRSSW